MLLIVPLLCSLASFALASPIKAAAAAGAPGVEQLTHVSTQLANLIQEIQNYEGGQSEAQQIFSHASEALKTLDEASSAMEKGPYIDLATATQYTPIALQLSTQVRTLGDTLKANKKVITVAGLGANVYQVLDITYSEASHLFKVFAKKTNPVFKPVINGWENIVIAAIADARTAFTAYAGQPLAGGAQPALQQAPSPAGPQPPFQWEQQQQAQPYPVYPGQSYSDQQAYSQQPYAPQPYYQQPYYPQPPYPQQAPPPGYAWALQPIVDAQGQAPPAPPASSAASPAAPAPAAASP